MKNKVQTWLFYSAIVISLIGLIFIFNKNCVYSVLIESFALFEIIGCIGIEILYDE